jgi:hypothetical protein
MYCSLEQYRAAIGQFDPNHKHLKKRRKKEKKVKEQLRNHNSLPLNIYIWFTLTISNICTPHQDITTNIPVLNLPKKSYPI